MGSERRSFSASTALRNHCGTVAAPDRWCACMGCKVFSSTNLNTGMKSYAPSPRLAFSKSAIFACSSLVRAYRFTSSKVSRFIFFSPPGINSSNFSTTFSPFFTIFMAGMAVQLGTKHLFSLSSVGSSFHSLPLSDLKCRMSQPPANASSGWIYAYAPIFLAYLSAAMSALRQHCKKAMSFFPVSVDFSTL